MPKTLFFNVPAHGHINPSLPLVAELVQRGHEVTYFATESYRQRVADTGATVEIYPEVARMTTSACGGWMAVCRRWRRAS